MAKKFIFFKKKISEIESIAEIVKALEKISAANVHNLKIVSQGMLDYEMALRKIFSHMAKENIQHPLLRKSEASGTLKIVLSTEKGLCGGLLNRLLDFLETGLGKEDQILVVGERGRKLLQERKVRVDHFFPGQKDIPQESETRNIKDYIISRFLAGEFGQALVFYPEFKNLLVQSPKTFSFLPFSEEKLMGNRGEMTEVPGYPIYEPSLRKITDYLIKEYLGMAFYQKVLETKLSELSARTMAMEEAGQKSEELISQLSYQYFRMKREGATKEINDLYAHRASA